MSDTIYQIRTKIEWGAKWDVWEECSEPEYRNTVKNILNGQKGVEVRALRIVAVTSSEESS